MALAEVLLAQDQADQAMPHALKALELLDALGTHERYEIEILLAAHDALLAVGSTAQATALRMRAQTALAARAARISDEAFRAHFTETVPHNRRVRRLATANPPLD